MTLIEAVDKIALSFTIASAFTLGTITLSVGNELKDKVMLAVGILSIASGLYVLTKYMLR